MAPIRRYLRISKYSVLECRIYLDNPALTHTWLLNSRDPVLPRVIQSVRPLVLPKLREENERAQGKGRKVKKSVKDVVVEDDFEVSIFLMDVSTRHSILTKQKAFQENKGRLRSNSSKMMAGATNDAPIEIEETGGVVIRQEEDDEGPSLADIPAVGDGIDPEELMSGTQRRKRFRGSEDQLFVEPSSEPEEEESQTQPTPPRAKRKKTENVAEESNMDDKKKLGLQTSYDGFSIYGRILCLVVKRRGGREQQSTASRTSGSTGQAMMEDWIASTQVPQSLDDG